LVAEVIQLAYHVFDKVML